MRKGGEIKLTEAEQSERITLESEIVSKVNIPDRKIYKGCVIRGSDPEKVARLRVLRLKARGMQE